MKDLRFLCTNTSQTSPGTAPSIKRTNPFSGQSEVLTNDEAMLYDMIKQAEQMEEYTKMQKGLDKFSRLNPKAYMTLLD